MRLAVIIAAISLALLMVVRVSDGPDQAPAGEEQTTETMVVSLALLDPQEPTGVVSELPELDEAVLDLWKSPEERESEREAEAFLSSYSGRSCRGDVDGGSYLSPRQDWSATRSDGSIVPIASVLDVVRVGSLTLPSGHLAISGGDQAGFAAGSIEVGPPGQYPYYQVVARTDRGSLVPFAQLVLDEDSEPVRWALEPGFDLPGGDSNTNWIGSPEAAARLPDQGWLLLSEPSLGEGCRWYEIGGGVSNAVLFLNEEEGSQAAAGYDSDGRLIAITWLIFNDDWSLAGLTGDTSALE